jgi:hypothetical protein
MGSGGTIVTVTAPHRNPCFTALLPPPLPDPTVAVRRLAIHTTVAPTFALRHDTRMTPFAGSMAARRSPWQAALDRAELAHRRLAAADMRNDLDEERRKLQIAFAREGLEPALHRGGQAGGLAFCRDHGDLDPVGLLHDMHLPGTRQFQQASQ